MTAIKNYFSNGHQRTILAKKNIFLSLCLKAIGMIAMFLLVSLSIKYIGNTYYGIWVTVSGVIAWSGMFDLGLSHGLRNRLAEAKANNRLEEGKYYVSTTFAFLLLISFILTIILIPLFEAVNWSKILNLPSEIGNEIIVNLLYIIFFLFILQFILKPINSVLQAYQWPAISQAIGTLGGVVIIISIFLLNGYSEETSIYKYAFIVSGVPVLVLLLATIILFKSKFKKISPSFKYIKLRYFKSIAGLGMVFFIIQISLLFIYSSDNLIISYLFGPKEVTTYNVVYRYFSIITIFFSVIMTPFWSAITEAYVQEDMLWIKKNIRVLIFIVAGGAVITFLLFLVSTNVYHIWIREDFFVTWELSALMGVYAVVMGWQMIFSFFSNGIGKIRVQLIAYLIAAIANLPLSYYFGKNLNMGSNGVLLATITSITFVSLVLTIQYIKVINNNAKGIWNV